MRARRALLAAAVLFGLYFPAALYLRDTHIDTGPIGTKPLHVYSSAYPGVYAATLWMPVDCSRATIYENGIRVAEARLVVDHPDRSYIINGRRWKVIEFTLPDAPDGRAYHGRPC